MIKKTFFPIAFFLYCNLVDKHGKEYGYMVDSCYSWNRNCILPCWIGFLNHGRKVKIDKY